MTSAVITLELAFGLKIYIHTLCLLCNHALVWITNIRELQTAVNVLYVNTFSKLSIVSMSVVSNVLSSNVAHQDVSCSSPKPTIYWRPETTVISSLAPMHHPPSLMVQVKDGTLVGRPKSELCIFVAPP